MKRTFFLYLLILLFTNSLLTSATGNPEADNAENNSISKKNHSLNPGMNAFRFPPANRNMKNFYAWCIVPFDNQNRSPKERIEMLKRLGFTAYAYDWRKEHLPEMAKEIQLASQNGIEINGVYMPVGPGDAIEKLSENNQKVFQILEETGLESQIWVSFSGGFFRDLNELERLEKAINMVSYLSREAEEIGCKIGLYNHRGWFGYPENMVKIIESLPEKEIGIIFNFHHAHEMLDEFPRLVKIMMPYLWAVNLNGMVPGDYSILPLGSGEKEREMIAVLKKYGYKGPYGILGHVNDADVEKILKTNLEGLKTLGM